LAQEPQNPLLIHQVYFLLCLIGYDGANIGIIYEITKKKPIFNPIPLSLAVVRP
jgi:hypothetical protein